MTADEHNPIRDGHDLPAPELGDRSSDDVEPEYGAVGGAQVEVERVDLIADEPDPDDDNPLGGVL